MAHRADQIMKCVADSYTADKIKEVYDAAYSADYDAHLDRGIERSSIMHRDAHIAAIAAVAAYARQCGPNGEVVAEACEIMRKVFNDVRLADLQFDNLDRRMQAFLDQHDATQHQTSKEEA